jgi:regulation of enolase protein 1 (concanavalin A-like superfamily)
MLWLNPPPAWQRDGNTIDVTTGAATDFWRRTHYGFIRDNGHFGYEVVEGDFVIEVKVSGQYRELYDQAGIMLRSDATHWIKTGIEYVGGIQYVSAVVTNEFSDWAVAPLPQNPPSIWLRVTRQAEWIEVQYALDGTNYTLLRLAYLPPAASMMAGIMCAAPDGSGFDVRFEGLTVRSA